MDCFHLIRGHPTSRARPRPLLPLSRRGQASKISDCRRGGCTCELQGGQTTQHGAVVRCGAAGQVRRSYLVSSKLAMVSEVSCRPRYFDRPSCTFDWQWTRPRQQERRMQAGVSLSCALDPPGRLSTLVHTATVDSLPSGHRCLSGPLHSAAALFAYRCPRRLVSCRGRGRRDTVAVFVAVVSTIGLQSSSVSSSLVILLWPHTVQSKYSMVPSASHSNPNLEHRLHT